jgi:predicted RNase H-like nuclease
VGTPPIESQQFDAVIRLYISGMDEASSALKLYFGLNTGAVVLFVNLLATSHAPRLVLMPLGLSIFAFGLAAIRSIRLFVHILGARASIVMTVADRAKGKADWNEQFQKRSTKWQGDWAKDARVSRWLFNTGIICAGVFVVLSIIAR